MENFMEHNGELWRYSNPARPLDGVLLRENYARHHARIESGADVRACLRAGVHAWPGGYPTYFYTSDGGCLSHAAVRDNLSSVLWSIRHGVSDGWRVVGLAVCYGDGTDDDPDTVYCDETGEPIA